MWQAWWAFWRIIDGFFVPQILAMCVVLVALRYFVRGIKRFRNEVSTRDVEQR